MDSKEIQPVHPKGDQSWVFIGRTDVEAETPVLWPLDVINWLIWIDPDARKDWRQEERGTAEDEMVGWHHRLNRHEFEKIPGVGDGQGGLVCYSPWGCKESDTTEWVNWMKEGGKWIFSEQYSNYQGLPGDTTGKEPASQCRRHKRLGFDPWVRKITWRRAWQPTPIFLLG